MPTIEQSTTFPPATSQDVAVTTWRAMAAGDDGAPARLGVYSDRTVQAAGLFGGAAVVIEGSNDGDTYHTLTDPQGNALSFSAPGLETVMELPVFVRPRVVDGDGTTAINIIMSGRRSI